MPEHILTGIRLLRLRKAAAVRSGYHLSRVEGMAVGQSAMPDAGRKGVTTTKTVGANPVSGCSGRFSVSKTHLPIPGHEDRQTFHIQAGLLTYASPARHSLLGKAPNGRLSSYAVPPRIQWRHRSGFPPDSLFSARFQQNPAALEWVFT